MRVFKCLVLVCCLACLPRVCTGGPTFHVQEKSQDFWLLQARLITDDILKDVTELNRLDRALLLARLSAAWWRRDQEQARTWMQKAIGEVEVVAAEESPNDRRKRISVVRTLLTIAAPLDEQSNNRLTALLTSEESKSTPEDADKNATGLVQAALSILDTDPARAAALGSASLRAGKSWSLPSLLSRLRLRNQILGDALFNEALASATTGPHRDLLASLTTIAFNGPAPSDDLRRKVLVAISREFVGTSTEDTNIGRGCSLGSVVAPLIEQFDQLLPEAAATVRGGLLRCQKSHLTSSDPAVDRALDNQPIRTVDDLLNAAGKASSTQDKVTYLSKAAYQSAQEKNFERALAILDGFTEEELKDAGETWDNWRWEFASAAAIARLKKDDRYGMEKIINSAPAKLRAFVQVSVAEDLANHGDLAGAIELLEASRKGLLKHDTPNWLEWYQTLLRRYAKLASKEGPQVFREFVAVNNRAAQRVNASKSEKEATEDNLQPLDVPIALIQADLMTMKEASSSLQPRSMRVRARLGFLKSLLELARTGTRS